ncbi:Putative golgi SNAP receptor complex, subunit 1 [Septoria linicola]|uniref:Golgi SNAP receptor complex member 1 n=1 Tax=Septoria linicola TaxID=215465 RepID=A0A9Q9EG90_9PEZI|nr:putative golgi SNAP receptor complex, subunit 1 [Septoria linicola]USW48048.1 Putative golgi SNAP receptor complex, subunit 1 [Septoria linicola]
MTANMGSWAQLRQQARAQETQTESLFHTYAQFASKTDLDPQPTEDERRTEEQLNEILEKRTSTLASLQRTLDSEPSPSALKSTNLARHREILSQHRTELARLKSQISQSRDRANLLSNVRKDINSYRNAQNPEAQEAEYMLQERNRLDRSHNIADSVLSQAYAVNESFGLQRESLVGIQRRITGAAAQIPGINGLMQRIGSKKRRDGIILGSFIALCFLVLLWFW